MAQQGEIELYVDGGARGNPGPSACAYVIKSEGRIIQKKGFYLGRTTNNVAEYTGLIRGLEAVRGMGAKELSIFSDSELMVKQIIGEYRVKSPDLQTLFGQVQRLFLAFDRWQIKHVRREFNADADRLVNETLDMGGDETDLEESESTVTETLFEEYEISSQTSSDDSAEDEERESEEAVKILVEVVTGSAPNRCPVNMQKGQCFVFTQFVPAGVCIHAVESLLPSILTMQRSGASARSRTIKCNHPGCGAGFKLSVI